MSVIDRLPAKIRALIIVQTDGCWTWGGWHNDLGYAYVRWDGRDQPVARVIMELLGRISDPDDTRHGCKKSGCCNPDQMEGLSHREIIRRGRAATKMACKRGHDWTDPRNVRIRADGRRWCAACDREIWH